MKRENPEEAERKNFFIFAFLIQFSWIVVGPYCSLSGLVLCMLFYRRTYNQYYFNYSLKFLLIKHFLLCFTFFPTFQLSIDVLRLFRFSGKTSNIRRFLFCFHSTLETADVPLLKLNCIHAAWKSIAIYFVIRKQACDWRFSRAADIGYFMQPATQTDTTSTCTISDDFIKIYFVAFFTSLADPIAFLINQIVIRMIIHLTSIPSLIMHTQIQITFHFDQFRQLNLNYSSHSLDCIIW